MPRLGRPGQVLYRREGRHALLRRRRSSFDVMAVEMDEEKARAGRSLCSGVSPTCWKVGPSSMFIELTDSRIQQSARICDGGEVRRGGCLLIPLNPSILSQLISYPVENGGSQQTRALEILALQNAIKSSALVIPPPGIQQLISKKTEQHSSLPELTSASQTKSCQS